MIASGSTQGEQLCNFLLGKVLHKLPWPILEEALAPTGRPELAELFREITAVNMTGRVVVGGVSVANQVSIDSPIYGDQFAHLLRSTAPVPYDLEDELFRFADRAVRAARKDPSDRELTRQRQWTQKSHPHCYMCGVIMNFDSDTTIAAIADEDERERCKAIRYTCEHIWPQSWGGDSEEENFLPACHSCNNGKKANFATWAMASVPALVYGVEPNEERRRKRFATVEGTYRFALHYREAQLIARARNWTLKTAFKFLGPWEKDIRVRDEKQVADFFNMAIHRENLPLY